MGYIELYLKAIGRILLIALLFCIFVVLTALAFKFILTPFFTFLIGVLYV